MKELRAPKNVVEFAELVGDYYAALRKNGITGELADRLVIDWHARWVSPEGITPELARFATPSADVEDISVAEH